MVVFVDCYSSEMSGKWNRWNCVPESKDDEGGRNPIKIVRYIHTNKKISILISGNDSMNFVHDHCSHIVPNTDTSHGSQSPAASSSTNRKWNRWMELCSRRIGIV